VASGRGRAKISDFLTKLAENKTFAREYEEEPGETMEGFGLSPSQRALIRSGDLRRIREAIEDETGRVAVYFYIKRPTKKYIKRPTKKYIKK
jgi:hypothetical protein